jgi:hypothetical protein
LPERTVGNNEIFWQATAAMLLVMALFCDATSTKTLRVGSKNLTVPLR